MPKSELFSKLSKVFTRIDRARRPYSPLPRRAFLRLSALTAGSVALPACGNDDINPPPPSPPERQEVQLAVVGAGLAGLHAAYRLQQAGADVVVYEASSRVGGRTFTARGEFPDAQIAELGGELIDTNHTTMLALAEEFGLKVDDRQTKQWDQGEIWWVAGNAVPEATIVEQFTAVAVRMLDDLEAADSDDDAYTTLDETPLSDYLDEVVPSDDYPELYAVLEAAYRGEFGLEIGEQSALNLVYLIGSDAPDPFRIFGESDERYHLHEGNDAIASALAEKLGAAVLLGHRLTGLAATDDDRVELTLSRDTDAPIQVKAEHVVLALPFSVLRNVAVELDWSEEKQDIVANLGYGTNAKVMGAFKERVWNTEHDAIGAVTSDSAFQQLWDTSIGQDGESGILTNFLGGTRGVEVGDEDPEAYFQSVVSELEAVFPGVADAYVAGSARRMHWPTAPNNLGSYTCYRPGQWSFWQLEGEREGNVHFCGEHTSPDFQGWMEGAAETGAFVAAEVLDDLELAYPVELTAILALKPEQPTWGLGEPEARRAPLARRRGLTPR
jgi:monoamine oxidase